MRAFSFALATILLAASVEAQNRSGTFLLFEQHDRPAGFEIVWLNTDHMHSIQPCRYGRGQSASVEIYACAHMDDEQSNVNRIFRSVKLFAPAVREVLDLPNPTTPTAVITAPDAALVGTPVTLSVSVADPDYGDTWTYAWSESDATMRGGTFSDASAADTVYTPAGGDGTVVVQVRVTDDAGQSVVASHPISVTDP